MGAILRSEILVNSWFKASAAAAALLAATVCLAAFDAAPPKGVDLSGHWRVNTALSDDPEKMLQQRIDEDRKRYEQWMRKARENNPLGIPPLDEPPAPTAGTEAAPPPAANPPAQRSRNRRDEELRKMLGISDTLDITQSGAKVDIVSAVDSRRFEAGTRSQVSMPQGELADSQVGWDGQWFVIERRARRGPRMVEKYRLLKNGQLESQLAWSGDSPLAGMKVRRIYDRIVGNLAPPNPALGPVK